MTAVEFNAIWLNDALDPSDAVELAYMGDAYKVSETLGGGIEHDYASGRSRMWSTEQEITAASLSLEWATAAVWAWLKDHRGRAVTVRDAHGRKFHAGFHVAQAEVSTMPATAAFDKASLELVSVTHSEAV